MLEDASPMVLLKHLLSKLQVKEQKPLHPFLLVIWWLAAHNAAFSSFLQSPLPNSIFLNLISLYAYKPDLIWFLNTVLKTCICFFLLKNHFGISYLSYLSASVKTSKLNILFHINFILDAKYDMGRGIGDIKCLIFLSFFEAIQIWVTINLLHENNMLLSFQSVLKLIKLGS